MTFKTGNKGYDVQHIEHSMCMLTCFMTYFTFVTNFVHYKVNQLTSFCDFKYGACELRMNKEVNKSHKSKENHRPRGIFPFSFY